MSQFLDSKLSDTGTARIVSPSPGLVGRRIHAFNTESAKMSPKSPQHTTPEQQAVVSQIFRQSSQHVTPEQRVVIPQIARNSSQHSTPEQQGATPQIASNTPQHSTPEQQAVVPQISRKSSQHVTPEQRVVIPQIALNSSPHSTPEQRAVTPQLPPQSSQHVTPEQRAITPQNDSRYTDKAIGSDNDSKESSKPERGWMKIDEAHRLDITQAHFELSSWTWLEDNAVGFVTSLTVLTGLKYGALITDYTRGQAHIFTSNLYGQRYGQKRSIARRDALGAKVIDQGLTGYMVVDCTKDIGTRENPFVIGGPQIRFFACCALRTPCGQIFGTLEVADDQPRTFGEEFEAKLMQMGTIIEKVLIPEGGYPDLSSTSSRPCSPIEPYFQSGFTESVPLPDIRSGSDGVLIIDPSQTTKEVAEKRLARKRFSIGTIQQATLDKEAGKAHQSSSRPNLRSKSKISETISEEFDGDSTLKPGELTMYDGNSNIIIKPEEQPNARSNVAASNDGKKKAVPESSIKIDGAPQRSVPSQSMADIHSARSRDLSGNGKPSRSVPDFRPVANTRASRDLKEKKLATTQKLSDNFPRLPQLTLSQTQNFLSYSGPIPPSQRKIGGRYPPFRYPMNQTQPGEIPKPPQDIWGFDIDTKQPADGLDKYKSYQENHVRQLVKRYRDDKINKNPQLTSKWQPTTLVDDKEEAFAVYQMLHFERTEAEKWDQIHQYVYNQPVALEVTARQNTPSDQYGYEQRAASSSLRNSTQSADSNRSGQIAASGGNVTGYHQDEPSSDDTTAVGSTEQPQPRRVDPNFTLAQITGYPLDEPSGNTTALPSSRGTAVNSRPHGPRKDARLASLAERTRYTGGGPAYRRPAVLAPSQADPVSQQSESPIGLDPSTNDEDYLRRQFGGLTPAEYESRFANISTRSDSSAKNLVEGNPVGLILGNRPAQPIYPATIEEDDLDEQNVSSSVPVISRHSTHKTLESPMSLSSAPRNLFRRLIWKPKTDTESKIDDYGKDLLKKNELGKAKLEKEMEKKAKVQKKIDESEAKRTEKDKIRTEKDKISKPKLSNSESKRVEKDKEHRQKTHLKLMKDIDEAREKELGRPFTEEEKEDNARHHALLLNRHNHPEVIANWELKRKEDRRGHIMGLALQNNDYPLPPGIRGSDAAWEEWYQANKSKPAKFGLYPSAPPY